MPSYQNTVPPSSLSPGDVGFSFNNETFPAAPKLAASSRFPVMPANRILVRQYAGKRFSGRRRRP